MLYTYCTYTYIHTHTAGHTQTHYACMHANYIYTVHTYRQSGRYGYRYRYIDKYCIILGSV